MLYEAQSGITNGPHCFAMVITVLGPAKPGIAAWADQPQICYSQKTNLACMCMLLLHTVPSVLTRAIQPLRHSAAHTAHCMGVFVHVQAEVKVKSEGQRPKRAVSQGQNHYLVPGLSHTPLELMAITLYDSDRPTPVPIPYVKQ